MLLIYVIAGLILSGALYFALGKTKGMHIRSWLQKEKDERNSIEWAIDSLNRYTTRFVKVKPDKKRELEAMFERLGWPDTAEDFQASRVSLSIIAGCGFLLLAIITGSTLLYGAALAGAAFFYAYPMMNLKSKLKQKNEQISAELPDYIDLLILLMNAGLTPYQALKQTVSYHEGEGLRQDLQRMMAEMDTVGEMAAFERFAEKLGIQEAKQFAKALKQISSTDQGKAREILRSQSEVMRELKLQQTRKILKERPVKAQMLNFGVFGFIALIPLGIFLINFIKSFSGF